MFGQKNFSFWGWTVPTSYKFFYFVHEQSKQVRVVVRTFSIFLRGGFVDAHWSEMVFGIMISGPVPALSCDKWQEHEEYY